MTKKRTQFAAARKSAGHTQESLAAALGIDRSTVIRWEAGDHAPLPYLRPKLARLLHQSSEQLRSLIDGPTTTGQQLELNPDVDQACSWLDQQTAATAGTSQRRVRSALAQSSAPELRDRHAQRTKVPRSDVARALREYYLDEVPPYQQYSSNQSRLQTSILTRPDWVRLRRSLTLASNSIKLTRIGEAESVGYIDAQRAVQRLAEVQALGTRLTNERIYRLQWANIHDGEAGGAFSLAEFVHYALTVDLLEGELLDALAHNRSIEQGSLPLRDRYLPTVASVVDFSSRLCAGGVLALCAIKRKPGQSGEPDYLLLIQERSNCVVNTARQLSVIPKGFHQPLTDYRADSQLAHSLLRKMEEELFGRTELDQTGQIARRTADPMHPKRTSDPLKWLMSKPGRLRIECTGFGLNLVSGNYEFACLIVIEDEDFWPLFGGT